MRATSAGVSNDFQYGPRIGRSRRGRVGNDTQRRTGKTRKKKKNTKMKRRKSKYKAKLNLERDNSSDGKSGIRVDRGCRDSNTTSTVHTAAALHSPLERDGKVFRSFARLSLSCSGT